MIALRSTLVLSEPLILEAMELTKIRTKTGVITEALKTLIQREKLKSIKNYQGKVNLDIDLNKLRKR